MTHADVAPALERIDRDLAGDLCVRTLADVCGVSEFHFHRRFRAAVGESPKQYVRRLRLERAALRLRHGRESVTEVAFAVGYASHEAFTRAFRSRFGVPPQRFLGRARRIERPRPDELRIERLPPRRVAYVSQVGPYDEIVRGFERLGRWAGARGVTPGAFLGVYWDDQRITARERTRCQIAMVVPDGVTGGDEVGVRCLPAGDYAVFQHEGSPDERRRVYDLTFGTWLPALGRAPANAPPIEVYPSATVAHVQIALTPR